MGGRMRGQAEQLALRAFHEPRLLHQVARRVTTKREFGKHHQIGAAVVRASRVLDDQLDVAGKVADRGVNLSQGNFHGLSLVAV